MGSARHLGWAGWCFALVLSAGSVAWAQTASRDAPAVAAGIGGKGRIAPLGGVIALAPAQAGSPVERVLVREGDRVRKGDVVAVHADRALREIERDAAQDRLRRVEDAFAARQRVLELERQSARLQLESAQAEVEALKGLDDRTVAPRERRMRAQALAAAELAVRLADARAVEARASYEQDRRAARAQVDAALAALARAQAVAPRDATVIEVIQPGSAQPGQAHVTLADTSVMYVNAEFFEGDLARMAPGQKARISNPALASPLSGVVEQVGRIVSPASRLGKVTIRLDQAAPADRYIGMQVDVTVQPTPSGR